MTAPVLHVLPYDLARGAQVYARALRDALDAPETPHRTAALFDGEPGVLRPDHPLGTRQGTLRRLGFDPRAAFRLKRLVRELRPRVVVAHGGEPLKYCLRAAGEAPVVCLRIGVAPPLPAWRAALLGRQLRAASVIAGVSHEVLDESVDRFGVPRERCVFIPNGRDPALYPPATTPREGRPRLIFVGHVTRTKRPEVFVEVVERLRRRGLDFDARLVGDGPLLPELRPRAEAAGVEVLGRRSDVAALLADSDVFVFTSMPEGEGMPGVFIEAGLCGLASVATEVPGARTVIRDGETGFVVPHHDLDALEARVATLLSDRALRLRMGREAVTWCRAEFDLATTFDRWREVLDAAARGAFAGG